MTLQYHTCIFNFQKILIMNGCAQGSWLDKLLDPVEGKMEEEEGRREGKGKGRDGKKGRNEREMGRGE